MCSQDTTRLEWPQTRAAKVTDDSKTRYADAYDRASRSTFTCVLTAGGRQQPLFSVNTGVELLSGLDSLQHASGQELKLAALLPDQQNSRDNIYRQD